MKDFLHYLLENIVDHPDEIEITDDSEEGIVRLNVVLNEEDYPRVIGKQGYTVKALTDILRLKESVDNGESPSRVYINIQN